MPGSPTQFDDGCWSGRKGVGVAVDNPAAGVGFSFAKLNRPSHDRGFENTSRKPKPPDSGRSVAVGSGVCVTVGEPDTGAVIVGRLVLVGVMGVPVAVEVAVKEGKGVQEVVVVAVAVLVGS